MFIPETLARTGLFNGGEDLSKLACQLNRNAGWLLDDALPLWADAGFDVEQEMFEERLTFDGAPIPSAPRRLMVQARQAATYAAAALSGRFPEGADLALRAGHSMVLRYLEADGAPGWVFSRGAGGGVADRRRDLYAHAFAIFSLAWLLRLDADPLFSNAIDETLRFLDCHCADAAGGGYWDCMPRADLLRRQNPHMHLFEACITLFETTRSEEILARCRALCELAHRCFIHEDTGAIREFYDDDWKHSADAELATVEPGHLYEWAWLLRRYERISGEDQSGAVHSMLNLALRAGTDRALGRIVDAIDEQGKVRSACSRSWPHAEALKAMCAEVTFSGWNDFELPARILERMERVYCRQDLHGGWMDHVNERDDPACTFMPASTLYHVYFGIAAVEDLLAASGSRVEDDSPATIIRADGGACGERPGAPVHYADPPAQTDWSSRR